MSNTVAYLRVSTEKQNSTGNGLQAQQASITAYAIQQGLRIQQWYSDVCSGATQERDELQEMLAAARTGTISVIVVHAIDRLGRDLVAAELCFRELAHLGCRVISVTQFFEDNPAGALMRQILLAFAEHERALIKMRLAGGRKAAVKLKGTWLGGVSPIGYYHLGRGELGQLEIEASIVRRISEQRNLGLTIREIAALLKSEGILARGGKPYHPSTVAKILKRDAVYRGEIPVNTSFTSDKPAQPKIL